MITKNKHTPATLYLLNKNSSKNEEQRKSARLSFNKKKSSRSISQYQKWNPSKQSPSVPFQPVTRTNSEIKRIFLNKNQFALQNLPIEKKFAEVIEIFGPKTQVPQQPEVNRRKSRDSKSGQISLLSLRDESKNARTKSHVRMQSMVNHVGEDSQPNLQKTLQKIEKKFKLYEQHSQEWKAKYLSSQGDNLFDEIIKSFRAIIYDVIVQFRNILMGNVEYCQTAILEVSKQYESQIAQLKTSMKQIEQIQNIMGNVFYSLNQKHRKNILCSIVWENLQKKSTDLQEVIKQSSVYQEIKNVSLKNPENMVPNFNCKWKSMSEVGFSLPKEYDGDSQSSHDEESRDIMEEENWNDKFQDNERIKGVLKYIHNNNKQKQDNSKNLNSTGLIKQKNSDMKIENWRSFEKKQKSMSNFNKILSQR